VAELAEQIRLRRSLVAMTLQQEGSWRIHDEQDLGEFGRGRLRRVSVDLPDGVTFDQYVIVLPEAVVVAAVDTTGAVLMVRRHRFIVNRWVWELPGGYVDEGEDLDAAVARELDEETGWRPGRIEHLVTFQPMIGSADSANHVYAAYDCEPTNGVIDVNEGVEVRWVGLQEAEQLVKKGEIIGAASVVAISELKARTVMRR
jgi:ADP-ribose pyrophosphatase